MVRSHYPYLIQQRHRWFVRMVVPPELRDIVGHAIFKIATGETDQHRAATVAAPIIADLRARIRTARDAGKRLEQVTAEQLAERYRAERASDPEQAEITRITDVIAFVLKTHGHRWIDYARQVREAGYDAHAALRLLPDGSAAANTADRITGYATPFLTYLEKWKPDAGLKPRPLDQAVSTLRQFDKAVGKPIEQIEAKDVQAWIDDLINPDGETGLSAKTVNRKLGELRNYWRWLQSHQHRLQRTAIRSPDGAVRDPARRRKTKEEMRQRFRPEDVVRCWTVAEQNGDAPLAAAIKSPPIQWRPDRRGSAATDDATFGSIQRPAFASCAWTTSQRRAIGLCRCIQRSRRLLDLLMRNADQDGYLIHSNAQEQIRRTKPADR